MEQQETNFITEVTENTQCNSMHGKQNISKYIFTVKLEKDDI